MVGKCSWSRHLAIAVVFTIDTLTVSRHIHRGHLFCIEVCLQRRTCSEVWYNTVDHSCQVQHASEGEYPQPHELTYPPRSVWGLRTETVPDESDKAIYQIRCTPAQNVLQHLHGIVCSGHSLHNSSSSEEVGDVFIGIQPPTIGPSTELPTPATHDTLTSPSSRKSIGSSDSSKLDITLVHPEDTLFTGVRTEGNTTTAGLKDIATSEGSVVNKHANKVLQSFRKTGSSLDTRSEQQQLTTPSVPRRSSLVDVPESRHETVTDKTTSWDHTTSVEQCCCGNPPEVDNTIMADEKGRTRNYRCVSGYRSRTNIITICTEDCQWSRPSGSCLKVCGEPPQLYGAEPLPGDNTAGTMRQYKCSKGFSSGKTIKTTCLDTGKWTLPTNRYSCTVICEDPPDLTNAVLVWKDSAQVTYKCKDGFTPTTPILLKCLPTGTWTTPQKTCIKICGELPQLYGAESLPGDNIAGTIRLYKCSKGFSGDQKMETTCLDTGKWTLPSNRYACTVTCVEPPNLAHAVLVSKSSAEITYKCKDGFIPTTPILLECLPTGTWTTPTETCKQAGCATAPRYVKHATSTAGNSTYQGYKCTKHYKETGPIYSICVDGKWTTPTQKCIGKCGPAPEVDHAILGRTTATRQYYTCKPGSVQKGNLYAMCVGEKWIKPSGSCDAGCTTAPRYVMHAITTSGNSTYQSYKCAKRYQETGPIYSTCVNGKWTKPTEKCTVTVQCGPAPDVENAIFDRTTSSRQYYKCKPGYVQSGKLYAMCTGKKWVPPTSGSCDAFGPAEEMNAVEDDSVNQASGLSASWRHKGCLYTHNDYHAPPEVYVLEAATSNVVATIHIGNAANNDWEDIAVGPCGDDSCIYVGDIGGHQRSVDYVQVANIIYRVKEPENVEDTQVEADVLRFEGAYDDAYVLLVDPEETLYVVSNDEDDNVLHRLPKNWNGDTVMDAEILHSITGPNGPFHVFWSGDLSPDGSMLVLLQKNWIYYWDVGDGGIEEATTKPASASAIEIQQPQGATFNVDMSGLYVITEDTHLPMYFVKSGKTGSHRNSDE